MVHLDVASVAFALADGRSLLSDVSFSVGQGERVALIGANGAGKSTLLRIITQEVVPDSGGVSRSGSLAVMRQFITGGTVRELLLSVAPAAIRDAATRLARAEAVMEEQGSTESQMAFASAVAAWGDAGGYDFEVLWDACTVAVLGVPFEQCYDRAVSTLSGGEQKRLALEALLRGLDDLLLLDEPDNSLDVPANGGWKSSCARRARACSTSVTTGSSWRAPRRRSSPSNSAQGATPLGRMRAVSRRTTRRAGSVLLGWTSCAAAGMRNARSCARSCRCTSRRPPTTPIWPPATGPHKHG